MTNQQKNEANPQKESNRDKGKKDPSQHSVPPKKPNEEPENPIKEQKYIFIDTIGSNSD